MSFDDFEGFGRKDNRIKQMPIYQKGWELFQLGDKIASMANHATEENLKGVDPREELINHQIKQLRNDAMLICPKIAGAEGIDSYDLKMENAALIRKAGKDLATGCSGLKMAGFEPTEYLDILSNTVEEFRILFAEWVKTFDPTNYTIDRWGLFNPPGVNYDDHDPDDDIPFTPDDDFDDLT